MFYKGLLTEMQEMLNEKKAGNYRFLQANHKRQLDNIINRAIDDYERPESMQDIQSQIRNDPSAFEDDPATRPSFEPHEAIIGDGASREVLDQVSDMAMQAPGNEDDFNSEIEHYVNNHPRVLTSNAMKLMNPEYFRRLQGQGNHWDGTRPEHYTETGNRMAVLMQQYERGKRLK